MIKQNRYKLIYKFFISYLLVLMIPTFIWFTLYNRIVKIIENEIIKSNMAILEQGTNIMDNAMNDIDNMINEILLNSRIKDFKFVDEPFKGSNVIRLCEMRKDLDQYKYYYGNLLINSFILFKNNNVLMDSNDIYKIPEFYGNFLQYNNTDYNTWYNKMLNNYYQKTCLPVETVNLFKKDYNVLTYIYTLGYSFNKQGAMVFLLNNEYIADLFKGLDISDGGFVYIQDDKGNIISKVTLNNEMKTEIKPLKFDDKGISGIIEYNEDNNQMMATYTKSSYNDWRYIVVQPMHIVKKRVISIQHIVFAITLAYIILGIIIVFFFSYKNSKPIEDILDIILKRMNKQGKKNNTYKLIKNIITSLMDNNEVLEKKVKEQQSYLRNSFFESLFKGEFNSDKSIKNIANQIGLNFCNTYSVIIINTCKESGEYNSDSLEKLNYSMIKMEVIIRSIFSKDIYLHQSKANRIVVLYNTNTTDYIECKDYILKKLNELVNQIRINLDKNVTVGIGNFYNELCKISRSYDEANQALRLNDLGDNKNIFCYNEISCSEKNYYYPPEIQMKLLNFVSLGDKDSIKELLTEVFRVNFIERKLPLYLNQLFLCNVYSDLIKIMEKLSIEQEDILVDVRTTIKNINSIENEQEDIHFKLLNYYYSISDEVEQRKNSHNKKLVTEMKLYIKELYCDSEFNLAMVADKFNMSQSYVSQFFKEQTGTTFSEYLQEMRMSYARELLVNTDESISNIAQATGYSLVTTFARAFKRKYSVSAGQYRKNQKNS